MSEQDSTKSNPMHRPISRRTLLAAMIVAMPVVAPFTLNAQTGSRSCPATCRACTTCANGCIANTAPGTSCNSTQCNNHPCSTSSIKGASSSSLSSPFDGGSSSLTSGGLDTNPWQ